MKLPYSHLLTYNVVALRELKIAVSTYRDYVKARLEQVQQAALEPETEGKYFAMPIRVDDEPFSVEGVISLNTLQTALGVEEFIQTSDGKFLMRFQDAAGNVTERLRSRTDIISSYAENVAQLQGTMVVLDAALSDGLVGTPSTDKISSQLQLQGFSTSEVVSAVNDSINSGASWLDVIKFLSSDNTSEGGNPNFSWSYDFKNYTGSNAFLTALEEIKDTIVGCFTWVRENGNLIKDLFASISKGVSNVMGWLVQTFFSDLVVDYEKVDNALLPGFDIPVWGRSIPRTQAGHMRFTLGDYDVEDSRGMYPLLVYDSQSTFGSDYLVITGGVNQSALTGAELWDFMYNKLASEGLLVIPITCGAYVLQAAVVDNTKVINMFFYAFDVRATDYFRECVVTGNDILLVDSLTDVSLSKLAEPDASSNESAAVYVMSCLSGESSAYIQSVINEHGWPEGSNKNVPLQWVQGNAPGSLRMRALTFCAFDHQQACFTHQPDLKLTYEQYVSGRELGKYLNNRTSTIFHSTLDTSQLTDDSAYDIMHISTAINSFFTAFNADARAEFGDEIFRIYVYPGNPGGITSYERYSDTLVNSNITVSFDDNFGNYVPYAKDQAPTTVIHFETDAERTKEAMGLIVALLGVVVTAAVVAKRAARKKKLKKKAFERNQAAEKAKYQYQDTLVDPNATPAEKKAALKHAMKLEKKANRTNRIYNKLCGTSVVEEITSLTATEDLSNSDLLDSITAMIIGNITND